MRNFSLLTVLAMAVCLTACTDKNQTQEKTLQTVHVEQQSKNQPVLHYSNLVAQADQDRLRQELLTLGIAKERVDAFLFDVADYNQTMQGLGLVAGFQTSFGLVQYDQMALSEKWLNKHQDRHGHNCRLTTFRLMGDFIEIDNPIIENDTMLFAEKETMDSEQVVSLERQQDFLSLFSYVPAKDSRDLNQHIATFRQSWQHKGVHLTNDKISLVSVVFYNNFEGLPTTAELFVGHIGLLWQKQDKFFFLEKLSFAEPYQWLEFSSKQAVSDYLMARYDIDETGELPPFIMENNELIEGYRPNPYRSMVSHH